jgi:hypothetical protein
MRSPLQARVRDRHRAYSRGADIRTILVPVADGGDEMMAFTR